jgi:hypothetical protein
LDWSFPPEASYSEMIAPAMLFSPDVLSSPTPVFLSHLNGGVKNFGYQKGTQELTTF